ncbi:mads-box transcription factor 4 [Phtheirospermum japonicum]|uniref:Mads-box transcription factor 4 n=1 Tax=Phtheirospermum japonicum TaxID=374723 RepID=A0A830D307_9LAMI|nr:mads-box transcription factor 4 [Phtheirospermum japonicum]
MGRGKLRMQLIINSKARRKYFEKRKKSLEKAAKDLSTLCGVDIGMIVYAPAQGKHSDQPITIWPPGNQQVLVGLIDSYKASSCNKTYTLSDFCKEKTEKELKNKLQFDGGLMAKIDAVRRRINLMKGSTTESTDHVLKDYCNNSVDQESNMWKHEEQWPPNFVYYSDQANNNNNDQMMMMNYGGGVSNGMYGVDEDNYYACIGFDHQDCGFDVQTLETLPGSYTINDQMPLDMDWFSPHVDAGGSEERFSPEAWFLNQESFLND